MISILYRYNLFGQINCHFPFNSSVGKISSDRRFDVQNPKRLELKKNIEYDIILASGSNIEKMPFKRCPLAARLSQDVYWQMGQK